MNERLTDEQVAWLTPERLERVLELAQKFTERGHTGPMVPVGLSLALLQVSADLTEAREKAEKAYEHGRSMGEFDCKAHADLLSLQRDQLNCSCNYDRPGLCKWHADMIEKRVEVARQAGAEEMRSFIATCVSSWQGASFSLGGAIRSLPIPPPKEEGK